jgi:Tol biopolymer transport system component
VRNPDPRWGREEIMSKSSVSPFKTLVVSLACVVLFSFFQVSTQAAGIGKIAFASDRDGNFEIYSMDADGGAQTRLTEDPGEDFSPSWSPDGTRLAFVSTRDGNAEIYVMNADGSGQTRLTNNTAGDISPVWSPNGSQIGFVSNRDGNDEIYLMNPDGTNLINLTQNRADDSSFAFSPEGTRITFSSTREDSDFDIYTMDMGTGGIIVVRLTSAPGADINPSWSGRQIFFQSNRDENDEVYSMTDSGGSQTRLTNNPELDVDPVQSSDGTRIAFATARDGNLEIYLMNANGTGLTRLTNNSAADLQPAIQPLGLIPPAPSPGATTVQFSSADYNVAEDSTAQLTVTRTGDLSGTTTVEFMTVNGSASGRSDYTFRSGTLRFGPGESTKTITVLLTDDVFVEQEETLTVALSNPSGAVLGSLNNATITIRDNDTTTSLPNPIDEARFFVRQHYRDFLNREPDQAGWDFWTNQIPSCGNNPQCLSSRRDSTSAAFFLSPEFQVSGNFIYRMYKGSLVRGPGPAGRFPTYAEFIKDLQQVTLGIVVDNKLSPPVIEANRAAFAEQFVLRAEFRTLYDTLNNQQYVDKLFATTGIAPTAAERTALINGLAPGGGETRASVLRKIVDGTRVTADGTLEFTTRYGKAFYDKEFDPSFVLMEYFGYLRRDPDDAGFQFWLAKLRQFGNWVDAEMVRAFVTSPEYRNRFGP